MLSSRKSYIISTTIILSAIVISLLIVIEDRRQEKILAGTQLDRIEEIIRLEEEVLPIRSDEIYIGNPEAEIIIFEYGDLQCPFCQAQHPILTRLIKSDFGISGTVGWAFRHYPHIDEISHLKAESVECVKNVSGDIPKTWEYIGRMLERVAERNFPIDRIREISLDLDINPDKVLSCIDRGTQKEKVQRDEREARRLDATTTPFFVLVSRKDGIVFRGSQNYSYDDFEEIIGQALNRDFHQQNNPADTSSPL